MTSPLSRTAPSAAEIFPRLPAIGVALTIPSAALADLLARAGFDFALIDLANGPATHETALAQALAFERRRTPTLARPAAAGAPWIARALDLGVNGLQAPGVDTAEAARAAVAATRFAPQGRRGLGAAVSRAAGYGYDDAYEATWNDRAFVLIEIASPAALAEAPAIAAVDGVDGLVFAPADFAAASGYPGARALEDALGRMADAARASERLIGCAPFADRDAAALTASGVDLVTAASDAALLRQGAAATLAAARRG